MNTFLSSNRFPLFKEKRLAYKGGAEMPVIEQIEAKTALDKTAAAALKDEKVLWSESKEKGEVGKFLKETEGNIDKQIPAHLVKKTADEAYEKLGGKEAGPDKGKAALGPLKAARKAADDAATAKLRNDEVARAKKENPKLTKEEETKIRNMIVSTTAKWDAETAVKGLPKGAPKELVARVKAAGSWSAAEAACTQFDSDWEKAKDDAEAAGKIEDHKKQLMADMEKIALTAVQEAQKQAFDAARTKFVTGKAAELVPPLTKEEEAAITAAAGPIGLTVQREARQSARAQAAVYLQGLLSDAELKVTSGDIQKELESKFNTVKFDVQQKFINQVALPVNERDDKKKYDSDSLSKASPAVRAYVEGLADSYHFEKKQDREYFVKTAQIRIDSLPPEKRNDIEAVKGALGTTHIEGDVAAHWMETRKTKEDKEALGVSGDNDPDKAKKEKISGDYDKALNVMKANMDVDVFFTQRVAQANEFFKGKPDHEKNMRAYRNALMARIAQQDPKNVNMATLRTFPKPSTFGVGAMKVEHMPEDAKAATKMLPGTGAYARKLLARLNQAKAEVGTIIQFTYKSGNESVVYYGKYTGDNLVIFTTPPAKPKPETPKAEKPEGQA